MTMYRSSSPRRLSFFLLTPLLLTLFFVLAMVSLTAESAANVTTSPTKKTTSTVLYISAANGRINWSAVEQQELSSINTNHIVNNDHWRVHELVLDGFGDTMKRDGFQKALDESISVIEREIANVQPYVLVVASKGVSIATYLLQTGTWRGPLVLLSPIPNACDHIKGGSWETEWESTMGVIGSTSTDTSPTATASSSAKQQPVVVIGTGNSIDERMFIQELILETGICGDDKDACPTWFYMERFQGDHFWKNQSENAPHIAKLINKALELKLWHDNKKKTTINEL